MMELATRAAELLAALGLTTPPEDPLLQHLTCGVVDAIKAETHQDEVPEGLNRAAVYMAVGQYLQIQKAMGRLSEIDLDPVVRSIQEGDTSVTYAVSDGATPEQRLDGLITWMVGCGKPLYPAFRRFTW